MIAADLFLQPDRRAAGVCESAWARERVGSSQRTLCISAR